MLDKELLVFPLLTISVLGLIVASVFWPLYMSGALVAILDRLAQDTEGNYDYIMMAASFVAYLIAYFVMIFFNAALIACVKIRFAGGDPVVMDGLRASTAKLPQIFGWALVAATVGFVLNLLKNKQGETPSFILGLLGAGWSIAVYFTVPVLVSENVGPIAAVKRSVSVIKKTWGEALVSEIGLGLLSGLAVLGGIAFGVAGFVVFESAPVAALSIWGVGVVYALLAALIFSTLGSILKSALYVYAVEGKIPQNFNDDLIKHAFSSKG